MEDIRKSILSHEGNGKSNPVRKLMEWLVKARVTTGIKSPHFWIIVAFTAVFTYIYYFVVIGYRDIYVILFFYPLVYAAIVYRLRGVFICGIVFFCIALPQVILTEDVYSLIRALLFGGFAFLISCLAAIILRYLETQSAAYEEIKELNLELNGYIENLGNTQRQLIHSERLKAVGQLAASVAHEINNPLAGVLVYTKLLIKKMQSGSLKQEDAITDLQKIDNAVTYSSNIIRSLIDFARKSKPVSSPVVISEVIDQVLTLVGHEAEKQGIHVIRDEKPGLPRVMGDFAQLQQVLINLVVNAVQAMPDKGTLTIRTSMSHDNLVKISVHDTGVGITQENMEKLFTPFFTTKEEVKGVGLGLAVSYGIIKSHGGKIRVNSDVGRGSTFTVYLPPYEDKQNQLN